MQTISARLDEVQNRPTGFDYMRIGLALSVILAHSFYLNYGGAHAAEREGLIAMSLDILVICGSLRKGSYNAALARTLPALAPEGMRLTPAPRVDTMPHYNFDDQNTSGFPPSVTAFADAIRAADGVIIVSPEYN